MLKFWSIVSYTSVDLAAKCLQGIVKIKTFGLAVQILLEGAVYKVMFMAKLLSH